jgi:oligoendopeptidase F
MMRRFFAACRSLVVGTAWSLAYGVAWPADAPLPASPDASLRWDLGDLYPSPEAWTASYRATRGAAEELGQLKGALVTDAASMRRVLSTISDLRREALRLTTYANLRGDEICAWRRRRSGASRRARCAR